MLFVNGVNGDGAKRGIKGWVSPLGEISGANAVDFISIRTESFVPIRGAQWDSHRPAERYMYYSASDSHTQRGKGIERVEHGGIKYRDYNFCTYASNSISMCASVRRHLMY